MAFLDVAVSPSAHGGLQLPLLPLPFGLAHQPLSSGQQHIPFDMPTNSFIGLFPARKKVKRLHKVSILQQEFGGSPVQDSSMAYAEERQHFKEGTFKSISAKTRKYFIFKAMCKNLASSETGNCLTATYANSLDEFHSLKCELE